MYNECFVYIIHNTYMISDDESRLPPNKVVARISLTDEVYRAVVNKPWREYQEMLEHYFDTGQKLVTA